MAAATNPNCRRGPALGCGATSRPGSKVGCARGARGDDGPRAAPRRRPPARPPEPRARHGRRDDARGVVGRSASGIFLTPGVPSRACCRIRACSCSRGCVGGLLSLAGALANAELGAMYPHAGGDYVYLREAYHPAAGFLVGWLSFFVIYAGTVATLAIGFAEALAPHLGLGAHAAASALAIAIGHRDRRRSTTSACGAGALLNNLSSCAQGRGARRASWSAAFVMGGGDADAPCAPVVAGAASAAPLAAFGLALSPVLFTLPRLERVGVRRERDPRSAPQRCRARSSSGSASAPSPYLALNVVYLYALPLAALARRAATPARRRRSPSSARSAVDRRRAPSILALDPRLPERDHPGRAAHRLRDGARRPLRRPAPTRCIPTTARRIARSSSRRVVAIALIARAAALSRASSTTRPSRSCSRPWPTRRRSIACAAASPICRGRIAPGATRSCRRCTSSPTPRSRVGDALGTAARVRDRPRDAPGGVAVLPVAAPRAARRARA